MDPESQMMINAAPRDTPLRRDGFTFRRFFAGHDRCAMKVGTDGVLLGAWTPLAQAQRVLDIGTGCGLIALMVAQRTAETVTIDGVELDAPAAGQAAENFSRSPWAQRMRAIQGNILELATLQALATPAAQNAPRYDLIVSNPPFFAVGVACGSAERDRARHTSTLTHQRLLEAASGLMSPRGLFSLVLPRDVGEQVISLAQRQGWHLRYRTQVADRIGKAPHRLLLGFSPAPGALVFSELALRDADGEYSAAYRALAGEFYLSMTGVATPARGRDRTPASRSAGPRGV